jgi:periplasmic copper chaperone A
MRHMRHILRSAGPTRSYRFVPLPDLLPPWIFTMTTKHFRPFHTWTSTLSATLILFAGAASAQTTVTDPWIRGTVAQQKATGMFAQVTSASGGTLVAARSPVASVVEIHEMRMDGDVMRMRAVPGLELPAGKAVALKPGGYHVMLIDLKQPLKPGETVPVTLVIEGKDGKRETVELQVPVKDLTTAHGSMKH